MKKAKKILALLLCAVLLVGATVMGTLAYLTSTTQPVKNTFTVGKVAIELHETEEAPRDDGTVGLDLHLVPGVPQTKDPAVTVKADSEDCYVRAKVTVTVPNWDNTDASSAGFNEFANSFASAYIQNDNDSDFNTANWTSSLPAVDTTNKTITYYLTYKNSETANVVESSTADQKLPALFTKICVPDSLDNIELSYLKDMTIEVEAHAIQADGFENTGTAEDDGYRTAEQNAWDAFNEQTKP